MKNRKLSRLSFDDAQILSREELKRVLGGDGYGGGGYGGGVAHATRCACLGATSAFYCNCSQPDWCLMTHCPGGLGVCVACY